MASVLKNKVISSLRWTFISLIFRDALQFVGMIFLVRYIAPEDYGVSALVQSITGVISIFSYNTFSTSIYQKSNREKINWGLELNVAIKINLLLFFVTIIIGILISFFNKNVEYLIMMSLLGAVFILEIFSNIHHRKLEIEHRWARFRIISYVGALLSIGVSIIMAVNNCGVWSIIIQPVLFILPSSIDYFTFNKFSINKNYKFIDYIDEFKFGFWKILSLSILKVKYFLEQLVVTGAYSFIDLGILNRAQGLSNILIGRLGGVLVVPLTPTMTELDKSSSKFKILILNIVSLIVTVNLVLSYTLNVHGELIVNNIYGDKWLSVNQFLLKLSVLAALSSIMSIIGMIYVYSLGMFRLAKIDSIYGVINIIAISTIYADIKYYLIASIVIQSTYFMHSLYILHKNKVINAMTILMKNLCIAVALVIHYKISLKYNITEKLFSELIILIVTFFIIYNKLLLNLIGVGGRDE